MKNGGGWWWGSGVDGPGLEECWECEEPIDPRYACPHCGYDPDPGP
jgi:hypothetical protein